MVAASLACLAQAARKLPTKAAIELTDTAAERIRHLLDSRHKVRSAVASAPLDALLLGQAQLCPRL